MAGLTLPILPATTFGRTAESPLADPAVRTHLRQLETEMRLGSNSREQHALIRTYLEPSEILEASFSDEGYRLTFSNCRQHTIELSCRNGQRLTKVKL